MQENKELKEAILRRFELKCVTSGACRLWPNKPNRAGYYNISIKDCTYPLHRVVYWIKSDYDRLCDLPSDQHVRHLCMNRNCTTPDHYSIGTRKENEADKVEAGTKLKSEDCPFARMDLSAAQKIADSWKLGICMNARAKIFKVSFNTIKDIDERRTWPMVIHPNGKSFVDVYAKRNEKNRAVAKERHELLKQDDYEALQKRFIEYSELDYNTTYNSVPCRIWRKMGKNKVYARFTAYGHTASAHVWACEIQQGHPMRSEKPLVRHLCNNKRCVEFMHVIAGTHTENMQDVRNSAIRKVNDPDAVVIKESNKSSKALAIEYGVSTAYIKHLKSGIRNRGKRGSV